MNLTRLALAVIRRVRNYLRRFRRSFSDSQPYTGNYNILTETRRQSFNGWHSTSVAAAQHQAFAPLLQSARRGKPRRDFAVAAEAIKATGLSDPLVVEVGCGSGYYSEILPLLLERSVRYVGLDYANSMTVLARQTYPGVPFATGDACCIPLKDSSCDVLLSGTSLMHIPNYHQAVSETVRVSKRWCIFHTVPVLKIRDTTLLTKMAYGKPVIEVIFNQSELESIFDDQGLTIRDVFDSIPYDVADVVGESSWTLTYLCEKNERT